MWRCDWEVTKYRSLGDLALDRPADFLRVPGNLLMTTGIQEMLRCFTGQGVTLAAISTRIGIGNGVGDPTASDTNLFGASTWWQVLDAAAVVSGNQLKLQATVGPNDANFAWNEFAIELNGSVVVSGASGGVPAGAATLLNHRTGARAGTKVQGQAYIAQATLAIT